MTCVYWIGKPGNIQAVEGQVNGGISHSIGFALSENYDDLKKHANMFGAGVPYIKDVPDKLVSIDVGGHDPRGPFGSSGASEAFQSSDHMAVINAINNAVGVRVYELPATCLLYTSRRGRIPGSGRTGTRQSERREDLQ